MRTATAPAAAHRLGNSRGSGLNVAGFGIRFGGFVIDFAVFVFLAVIVTAAIGWLGLLTPLFAQLIFNTSGVSPGKAVVGIRIVSANGDPPGFAAGLGRTLVAICSWWLFLIGYFWAVGEKEHRTWHDLAAGTYVISQ